MSDSIKAKTNASVASVASLQQLNASRWKRIESLHEELRELEEGISGNGNSTTKLCSTNKNPCSSSSSSCTNVEAYMESDYYKAELDQLKTKSNLNTSGESVFDDITDAKFRHSQIFTEEISTSYEGLIEANHVIHKMIGKRHDEGDSILSKRIKQVEGYLDMHKQTHRALLSMKKRSRTDNIECTARTEEVAPQQQVSGEAPQHSSISDEAKRESSWIFNVISRLSSMLEKQIQGNKNPIESIDEESNDNNSTPFITGPFTKKRRTATASTINESKSKRHLSKNSLTLGPPPSAPFNPYTSYNMIEPICSKSCHWSLERVLEELAHRLLSSSMDPYLLVNENISLGMVDLLCRCGVVEFHPNNPKLIRMMNYTE